MGSAPGIFPPRSARMARGAVILVAAAITIPNVLYFVQLRRLERASREVLGRLLEARAQALSERAPFRMVFTPNQATYSLERGAPATGALRTVKTYQLPHGAAFDAAVTPREFAPDGSVHPAGTIVLRWKRLTRKIVLSADGSIRLE